MTTPPSVVSRHRSKLALLGLAALLIAAGLTAIDRPVAAASAAAQTTGVSSAPGCVAPERPKSPDYDRATRQDRAFNKDFRHCFITINAVQMHYIIGGHGPHTMALLHGWPPELVRVPRRHAEAAPRPNDRRDRSTRDG